MPALVLTDDPQGGPLIPSNSLAGVTGGEFFSIFVALQNPQARGHLTLASSDAKDPSIIHPNYLDHEFDRQNLAEAFRSALAFMDTPTMKKHRKRDIVAPQSSSTEDIEVRVVLWRSVSYQTDMG